MKPNEYYMQQVLTLASDALGQGELPIAAMIILDDNIISEATTSEVREKRFLGHAELVALENADKQHLSYDQRGRATLYTNLEPCMMCMGAAMSFFIGEIVYGLESPGDGAVEMVRSWIRKEEDMPGYRVPQITGGILRKKSISLFDEYVAQHDASPMRNWAKTLTTLRGIL